MPVYVMALDSTAIMPENQYYIWYKGLHLKYNKSINPHTKKQDLSHTDSFLTIFYEKERDILRKWPSLLELGLMRIIYKSESLLE